MFRPLFHSIKHAFDFPGRMFFLACGWPVLPALPGMDPADRRDLLFRHRRRIQREMERYAWLFALGPALAMALQWFVRNFITGNPLGNDLPGVVIAVFLVSWIYNQIAARKVLPHVREELRGKGLCTDCGFDLRATPTCCPECGSGTGRTSNL